MFSIFIHFPGKFAVLIFFLKKIRGQRNREKCREKSIKSNHIVYKNAIMKPTTLYND